MPDPVEGAPAPVPTDPAQPQKPLPQFVDDPFNADPARVREAPPAPEPPKKAELVDTLNTVQGILEALIPPEGDVVMTDTAGNKYRLRRSLPAAVETKILRRVEALANLSEDVAGPEFALRFRAVLAGGAPATVLMNVVRLLSSSDVLLGTLSECAAMAHPQVLAGARAAAKDDPDSVAMLASLDVTPETAGLHHLFDVVELVQSLLPFVSANARKLTGLLKSMLLAS